jgi:hypothetical protein
VYCPSTSSNLVWVKEYFSSMGLSVSDNILREQLSRLRASVGDSLLVPYFDYGRRLFLEITPEKRVQLLGELEQVFDRYTPQG